MVLKSDAGLCCITSWLDLRTKPGLGIVADAGVPGLLGFKVLGFGELRGVLCILPGLGCGMRGLPGRENWWDASAGDDIPEAIRGDGKESEVGGADAGAGLGEAELGLGRGQLFLCCDCGVRGC